MDPIEQRFHSYPLIFVSSNLKENPKLIKNPIVSKDPQGKPHHLVSEQRTVDWRFDGSSGKIIRTFFEFLDCGLLLVCRLVVESCC